MYHCDARIYYYNAALQASLQKGYRPKEMYTESEINHPYLTGFM